MFQMLAQYLFPALACIRCLLFEVGIEKALLLLANWGSVRGRSPSSALGLREFVCFSCPSSLILNVLKGLQEFIGF